MRLVILGDISASTVSGIICLRLTDPKWRQGWIEDADLERDEREILDSPSAARNDDAQSSRSAAERLAKR